MVQISGKYSLVQNENLVAYLTAFGIPEEKATKADAFKPTLEVILKGEKIQFNSDSEVENASSTLVLNEEVDELMPLGITLKSTAKLTGDTLVVTSTSPEGKNGKREYKFSDTELILTLTSTDPGVPVARRVYKRI